MATLTIGSDCLTARNRRDLLVIEAAMLWPNDEAAQRRWINAGIVQHHLDSDMRSLPESGADGFARLAGEATPIADLQASARKRASHGAVAGSILRLAVREAERGDGYVIQDDIISLFLRLTNDTRKQHHVRLSKKTIQNAVWPVFGPVAHLWAAHSAVTEWTGRSTCPCAIGDLPEFIRAAIAFRKHGERARHKHGAVLTAGESIIYPPEIEAAFGHDKLEFTV